MKAIVANVIFGGIFGCLSWSNSTLANPKLVTPALSDVSDQLNVSASLSNLEAVPLKPQIFNLLDRIVTINELDSFRSSASLVNSHYLIKEKQPYVHGSEQIDLVLGFQNAFWPSNNNNQYWGITTVEHWGEQSQQLDLSQLNYTDKAPMLATGSSALTFSGGGNNNLAPTAVLDQNNYSQDFEEFRGGVTYHRGVASQLTMGVGLIYEDYLTGFTQLTYDSDILPVKTTFSLLVQESAIDLYSHIRFQPANNFVVNYYNDQKRHEFDLNWDVASNLTLITKGNIKKDNYSTGVKIAIHNDFMSLSATAVLDDNYNLQWKVNSQIGRFKFTHSSSQEKSSSELNTDLIDSESLGFQCSAFIKYQTRLAKNSHQEFFVWGAKLNSITKISSSKHLWSLEVGYGSGFHGNGLIVNGSVALKPNLSLKLDYQEASALSDDTKIKLQLSSN